MKIKSAYYSFLFSYGVLLLFFIVIGIIGYTATGMIMKNYLLKENTTSIDMAIKNIEERFDEIEGIFYLMSYDKELINISRLPRDYEPDAYYQMFLFGDSSKKYYVKNNFVKDIGLFFDVPQILFLNKVFYEKPPEYYGSVFNSYYNQMKQLSDHIQEKMGKQLTVSGGGTDGVITFAMPIKSELSGRNRITGLASISDKQFADYMVGINEYVIFNADNQVLLSKNVKPDLSLTDVLNVAVSEFTPNKPTSVEFKNFTAIYRTSSQLGITAAVLLSDDYIAAQLLNTKRIYFVSAVMVFLIGIGLSFVLAYRNSLPIKNIIAILSGQEGFDKKSDAFKNEFEYISSSIYGLMTSNGELLKSYNDQLLLLRTEFFDRLIKGGWESVSVIESYLNLLNIDFANKAFAVVYIKISLPSYDDAQSNTMYRLYVHNAVDGIMSYKMHTHQISLNEIAVILSDNALSYDVITRDMERVKSSLKEKYSFGIVCCMGDIVTDISRLEDSYYQAKKISLTSEADTERIYIGNALKLRGFYNFGTDEELKLINSVKSASMDSTLQSISRVFDEVKDKKDDPELIIMLAYQFKIILYRIMNAIGSVEAEKQTKIFDRINTLSLKGGLDGLHRCIVSIFTEICEVISDSKSSKKNELTAKIEQYIMDNYCNSEISLSSISAELGFAPKYLSRFYKESTGVNLSDFLESTRLDRAVSLLASDDRSINEISGSVGYYSINSFYKAFKRVYSMSPGEYREKVRGDGGNGCR